MFYVWGVIKMYNADPITATCFWLLCILAAVSFLVTATFTLCSGAYVAVSGINSAVGGARRIQNRRND